MAIQGYDPLLPEALPYASRFCDGRFLNLRATLVTNGTDAVDLLKALALAKVSISLSHASEA